MITVDELLKQNAEIRRGLRERAQNDLASEMGFRMSPINGENFLVYNGPHQEPIPGLGGEAAMDMYRKFVDYRCIINDLIDGRQTVDGICYRFNTRR